MRGAMIETEARRILNMGRREGREEGRQEGRQKGILESRKETALKMLRAGKLDVEEIAEYSGLSVQEVEELAGMQTV